MEVQTPSNQVEPASGASTLECDVAAPINQFEIRTQGPNLSFTLDEDDSQNKPTLPQSRSYEPSASEPLASNSSTTRTIETNTIQLPIRSLEEQREYELIQDYLKTHPADTIFDAQRALYPKKYTRR